MKTIGKFLWDLSEFTGISLGRFGPTVFAWMVGAKAIRKKETNTYCQDLKEAAAKEKRDCSLKVYFGGELLRESLEHIHKIPKTSKRISPFEFYKMFRRDLKKKLKSLSLKK